MSAVFDIISEPDWAATTTVSIPTDSSADPGEWAEAVFTARNARGFVKALFVLREITAKILRIQPSPSPGLTYDRIIGNEAVINRDETHLHFVGTVRPDPEAGLLHVVTAVKFKSLVGRVYFVPVSILHDPITRSMMKSAAKHVRDGRTR